VNTKIFVNFRLPNGVANSEKRIIYACHAGLDPCYGTTAATAIRILK
jgi:hypothetical protein